MRLAAVQQLLESLSESWRDEQVATVQREQSMRSQWEASREEDKQLAMTAVSGVREEASKALGAAVDSTQQQLSELSAAQTSSVASLTSRLTEVQLQATTASDALKTTVESLTAQLTTLDEEVGSIRGVLDSYNDDISALHEVHQKAEQAVEGLRGEVERLLTTTSDLSSRLRRAESDVIEARREGTAQHADVQELTQHVTPMLQQVEAIRTGQEMAQLQSVSRQHKVDAVLQQLLHRLQALEAAQGIQHEHPLDDAAKMEEEQKREEPAETEEIHEEADAASHPLPTSSMSISSPPTPPGGPSTSTASTPLGRSHSASFTSPNSADLTSVFPSISSNDTDAQRQAGVFTSPAKVNSATSAMAWTINVKDGGASKSPAAARPASVSRDHSTTPRSGSVSVGRSGGAGSSGSGSSGGGVTSERSSPASSRTPSLSVSQPHVGGSGKAGTGQGRVSGGSGNRASASTPVTPAAAMSVRSLQNELDAAGQEQKKAPDPPQPVQTEAQPDDDDETY